jgi:hypothetical protein
VNQAQKYCDGVLILGRERREKVDDPLYLQLEREQHFNALLRNNGDEVSSRGGTHAKDDVHVLPFFHYRVLGGFYYILILRA